MQSLAIRRRYSSLSILGFLITVLCLIVYAEFFRRHENSNAVENNYSNVFNAQSFGKISGVQFKNRLGQFDFQLDGNQWKIITPREIDAKSNAVNEIVNKIKSLKIIKIYEKDAINLSNFSLEQPAISIKLSGINNNEVEYGFGLLNPIDNTTYVTSSKEKVIFQVNTLGRRIETMSLSTFLDSKIFSMPTDSINSFAIYRGHSKNAQLKIQKEKVGWKSSTGRLLDENPLKGYFQQLGNLSSTLIIDELSPELKAKVDEYLETPFYRIEFLNKKKKKVVFEISKLVTSLPTLKIERRKNVLVRSSDKKHLYLFSKKALPHFQKTQYSFKKLSLKKIFY